MTGEVEPQPVYRRTACPTRGTPEALVVQDPHGSSVALRGPSARIWELLEYPVTHDRLCQRLASEFRADPETMAAHVMQSLDRLLTLGLIIIWPEPVADVDALRWRYLHDLKRSLVNLHYPELELRIDWLRQQSASTPRLETERALRDLATEHASQLHEIVNVKWDGSLATDRRVRGHAHTQIGLLRLDNIERCAERVFADHIEGDFLEAGVCRGGAAIFMRALQVAYHQDDRRMWLADSFEGLPPPSAVPDVAAGLDLSEPRQPWLACGADSVREHFRRYDLLDGRVRFLEGYFAQTLPSAPVERLAILRIDADLYSSTREVLETLYDRVAPGGFVIVDDYGALAPCRQAVDEFRALRRLSEPLLVIDWTGVYWRRER